MNDRQPVVVTTERGVFFGYIPAGADTHVSSIRIEDARMCVYWSADVKGVLGLAATGPSGGCKIGPKVPAVTIGGVTAVIECSRDAETAWDRAPWSK